MNRKKGFYWAERSTIGGRIWEVIEVTEFGIYIVGDEQASSELDFLIIEDDPIQPPQRKEVNHGN